MYSSEELFERSREGYFGVYFPSCEAMREINIKNTWVSAETVRHESTYIISFLTWHSESINDDENDDFYRSSPCLTHSVFFSADDVTIDCWWRHNDQTIVTQSRE